MTGRDNYRGGADKGMWCCLWDSFYFLRVKVLSISLLVGFWCSLMFYKEYGLKQTLLPTVPKCWDLRCAPHPVWQESREPGPGLWEGSPQGTIPFSTFLVADHDLRQGGPVVAAVWNCRQRRLAALRHNQASQECKPLSMEVWQTFPLDAGFTERRHVM